LKSNRGGALEITLPGREKELEDYFFGPESLDISRLVGKLENSRWKADRNPRATLVELPPLKFVS